MNQIAYIQNNHVFLNTGYGPMQVRGFRGEDVVCGSDSMFTRTFVITGNERSVIEGLLSQL